jgi:hypothetical protein
MALLFKEINCDLVQAFLSVATAREDKVDIERTIVRKKVTRFTS